MPTFIGYNTIGQAKKFVLTDYELVKRDLLNAFSIKQGELPGRPEYGCQIWQYVFEPQTSQTAGLVQTEIERIVNQDPRIYLSDVQVYAQENGMLIDVQITVLPNTTVEQLSIYFDRETQRASFQQ